VSLSNIIHEGEPQLLKINSTVTKDKEHMANVFNEYFISVAQTIIDDLNKDNKKIGTHINYII
jgi:hypothetical protein